MPRPSKYTTRSDLGWGPTPADPANPRSGLVIHYDSADQVLANKPHSACLTYWRNTRSFHTGPSRGWADIGYSFMACAHGYVLEGRGLNRTQAAQPGGNTSHYSVTLATGPNDEITSEQINAVRELRQWLMESPRDNAGKVLGHRDFIATSCPGDRAYALVTDGTFTQAPGTPGGGMEDDLIGLKEGDGKNDGLKEQVIALQRIIGFSGFASLLGPDPDGRYDGHWGPNTTRALLALRQSVGSKVSDASSITGTAYAHLEQALIRAEARKLIAAIPGGGSGGALPATVRVSGELEVQS